MKIETALKDYLLELEIKKYSVRTLKSYRINVGIFARFCAEELNITDVDELSMGAIKQFTAKMMQNGRKGSYINSLLKAVKSFIQFCYEEDYGGFNTKKVSFKWVKQEKTVIRTFTPRDVKLMLDNCRGADYLALRDTAILTMLFETGIRCLELCSIKKSDIHDDFIIIQGKNHKQRVVPITPILRKALIRYDRVKESYFTYRSTEEYYFLSNRGRMLTNSGMEHMLHRRGKGIKDIRVSPHTCRHFFAQQQLKMGTDIYTLSRLLGHESISITQIYLNSLKDSDIIKMAKQQSVLANF